MDNLQLFDYIVLAVLLVSTLLALMRGFTRELLSILSWVLAFYGALFALPLLQPYMRKVIAIDWLADLVILAGVFILIMVITSIIAYNASQKLQKTAIGHADRVLGGLFGGLRGVLIVVFGFFVFTLLLADNSRPDWIKKAYVTPVLEASVDLMVKWLPIGRMPMGKLPMGRLPLSTSDIDKMTNGN